MLTALAWSALAGIPFGSPKPPVCTCEGARAMVGVAELPVENTLVFTACLGMTGAGAGGSGSNFLGGDADRGSRIVLHLHGSFRLGCGKTQGVNGRIELATTGGCCEPAHGLRLMVDRNRSALRAESNGTCAPEAKRPGDTTSAPRSEARSPAACMPVLKTNSVQGVLVSGSREKRFSWEAEELISALLVSR